MLHKDIQFHTAQSKQSRIHVQICLMKAVLRMGNNCTSLLCSTDWFCSSAGRSRIPLTVVIHDICSFKVQNGVICMIYALIFPTSY